MKLEHLKDQDLLIKTKEFVQAERDTLMKILHCFREIERRKLYSDFGYGSLFEYAVNELHYSEGQAGRRIQAMRLLKEIPELEHKIESGALSLSNISNAQGFFREIAKNSETTGPMLKEQKLEILERLENKSAREGQRELLKIHPQAALPKERERIISEDQSEIRFVLSTELKEKLEMVRSLLGPKGTTMNFAELLAHMTDMSVEVLKGKKFGKKRAAVEVPVKAAPPATSTPTPDLNTRYISKEKRLFVWQRDGQKCVSCKSRKNLQIDHVKPFALGGKSNVENLRLLCFACNQRAAVKTFGIYHPTGQSNEARLFESQTY